MSPGRARLVLLVLAAAAPLAWAVPGPEAPRGEGRGAPPAGTPALSGGPARAARLPQTVTLDDLAGLRAPGHAAWAPAGGEAAFLRDEDGVAVLFRVATREDAEATPVSDPAEGAVTGFDWRPGAPSRLVWSAGGDLWRGGAGPGRRVTAGEPVDTGPVFDAAGERLAFVRDGDLWVLPLAGGEEARRLSDGLTVVGAPRWSPGGGRLAARVAPAPAGADLVVIEVDDGTHRWLERGLARPGEPRWSGDGRVAWQETEPGGGGRRILVAGPRDWRPRELVAGEHGIGPRTVGGGSGPRWEPGSTRIAFLSERDGWRHAWLVDAGAGPAVPGAAAAPEPVQLTAGEFEVDEVAWAPGGGRLVVVSSRGSASERGLHLLDVPAAPAALRREEPDGALEPISRLRGTSMEPAWSPDGARLLFLHADPRHPLDLWVQEARDAEAVQLTSSWPGGEAPDDLQPPVPVRFTGADGELVPAQLILPRDADADVTAPALVWAHGGPGGHNRWGWPPGRVGAMAYGLHQVLVAEGYVVLAVDYRGSGGHGRGHRVAGESDPGGIDLDDLLAAGRYLRNLREPRVERVGVWGFGYGGYLVLQALVNAPPAFDAAVEIAGITDLETWARGPAGARLAAGIGPVDDDAGAYRARSPLHRAGDIRRPLLVLHGEDDAVVPVEQTRRLAAALEAAGAPFEHVVYPGEGHVFSRVSTWRDALGRVQAFLDRHLRAPPAGGDGRAAPPPGRLSGRSSP